jgi:predicted peroxiredoxin
MKKLGILVNTVKNLKAVQGIAKAASAKGFEVEIFAMDIGTKLLEDPSFVALKDLKNVSMSYCALSCENVGTKTDGLPEGIARGDQYRNTLMHHSADKAIIL